MEKGLVTLPVEMANPWAHFTDAYGGHRLNILLSTPRMPGTVSLLESLTLLSVFLPILYNVFFYLMLLNCSSLTSNSLSLSLSLIFVSLPLSLQALVTKYKTKWNSCSSKMLKIMKFVQGHFEKLRCYCYL